MARKHSKAFREMAVKRMKDGANVKALAEELGIHRRLLYKWREGLDPEWRDRVGRPAPKWRGLQQENRELKRALVERTLEVDFFKGALQKIEARRRRSTSPGETASTTRSGR